MPAKPSPVGRYSLVSSQFSAASGLAIAPQLLITPFILVPRYQAGLIAIGDLVLFITLLLQLYEPFNLVGEAIKDVADAIGRFRPFALMCNASEDAEAKDVHRFHPAAGAIRFENVGFRYPNGRGVSDLSFVVARGAPSFITGETGSGTSTVVRMLLKDLQPSAGLSSSMAPIF